MAHWLDQGAFLFSAAPGHDRPGFLPSVATLGILLTGAAGFNCNASATPALPSMVEEKPWTCPVYLALSQHQIVGISTTKRAAEYLVYAWPRQHCQKRTAALEACLAVLTAGEFPEHARQSFIQAARQAGVLVTFRPGKQTISWQPIL